MDKIFFEHKDYLPEGWTFEKIENLLTNKTLPLTKESLALFVSEKCLDMDAEVLYQYILNKEEKYVC